MPSTLQITAKTPSEAMIEAAARRMAWQDAFERCGQGEHVPVFDGEWPDGLADHAKQLWRILAHYGLKAGIEASHRLSNTTAR